ncbi:MAG: hypothetical protein PVI86_14965 [Phycisphaerae bacterium]|jgi:hypothetical protein
MKVRMLCLASCAVAACFLTTAPVAADEECILACCYESGVCESNACWIGCTCGSACYCSGWQSLCMLPNEDCVWVDEICWDALGCVFDRSCLGTPPRTTEKHEETDRVCWGEVQEHVCWADGSGEPDEG